MTKDEFIFKGVTIRKDQEEFLKSERQKGETFKLSKFLQVKLDEFIKFRKEGIQFMEEMKSG